MQEGITDPPDTEKPKILYRHACQMARSDQADQLINLQTRLTDLAFLAKLDSTEDYAGDAMSLRVAGVLQLLVENTVPSAREVLLTLTTSPVFLEQRARVELLIKALAIVRPASQQAVVFWDKHCQPEDGYSSFTIWALVENGSPPAIALFEKKMTDRLFPETEREYWLTACVLEHRNDMPLLQGCRRLLQSALEESYRLLVVDVLFDYKPEEWYGAGHWYKPPSRTQATEEALKELRVLGIEAMETQSLSRYQQEKIELTINGVV